MSIDARNGQGRQRANGRLQNAFAKKLDAGSAKVSPVQEQTAQPWMDTHDAVDTACDHIGNLIASQAKVNQLWRAVDESCQGQAYLLRVREAVVRDVKLLQLCLRHKHRELWQMIMMVELSTARRERRPRGSEGGCGLKFLATCESKSDGLQELH